MSVVYAATLKTNRMQLVPDLIASLVAAASTGTRSAGSLVIGTASLSGGTGVLVTLPLSTTPFTVAGAVATLAGSPSANASAGGTAALAEFRNNAGTTIISGLTVGTSGSDINLTSTTIANGQTVTMTGTNTITHG
jgi:hypothetical protein